MTNNYTTHSNSSEDFRLFVARIYYAAVFLLMLIYMVMGQLPYQLTPASVGLFPEHWQMSGVSVLATTMVLTGFFIPTKPFSVMTIIVLFIFNLSYGQAVGGSYNHFIWWALLIPLCFSPDKLWRIIKTSRWFLVAFAVAQGMNRGFNLPAIPLYSLCLMPFLPFPYLFEAFNRYYQPK